MKPIAALRLVGALVAAIATALILLIAVELWSAVVHPFPPGFKGTHEEMCQHVARYPDWVLALAVPMWGFTALASTWVAGWSGNRICAIGIGALLLAALVGNVVMLPYPGWFKIVMPIVLVVSVAGGYMLAARRKSAA